MAHGFPRVLTSFVGRAGEAGKVAGLIGRHPMVTVTGPGGVGKTRLAGEVAGQVAAGFADGAWLVELAAVADAAQVPAVVASVLGVQQLPGDSVTGSLVAAVARRQLLLVLDNCEHVLAAVAELCAALLAAADEVRVLAMSWEPVGLMGEARFRLRPLPVLEPGTGPETDHGGGPPSAVALFEDRARLADRTSPWMVREAEWHSAWWRGWMGCRWRSSLPPPGSRRWALTSCWTGWRPVSSCSPAGTGAQRRGTGRLRRRWNGAITCWTSTSGRCSASSRCFLARSPWTRRRRWPAPRPGRRCCTWWTARC